MVKGKLKKIFQNDYFPFVILAIGMFAIHMMLTMNSADDIYYSSVLNTYTLPKFLIFHYYNWSSRLIIETAMVLLLHLPLIIWRIFDTGIMILMGVSISKLVGAEHTRDVNWFIVIMIFSYPLLDMDTAGWVSTTLNCSWVLAFGIFSLLGVKRTINQQKIKKHEYVLYMVSLIYAVNQEQMCFVLLAIYLASEIYLFIKKKSNWFILLGTAVCMISVIFIFTCPGNKIRQTISVAAYFQDFNNFSIVRKLEIGITSTLSQYIFEPNLIFIILCMLLYASIRLKYFDKLYRILAFIPLVITLIFGVFEKISPDFLLGIKTVDTQITDHGLITLDNFTKAKSYFALIILCATFSLILLSLYLVFENTWKSILTEGTMVLGFLSRIAMGFSPTIWASSTRTYIYMYGALIICSVMIFQQIYKSKASQFIQKFTIYVGFAAAISYINMIMTL